MAWYEIVALFFFLGCFCAVWIALISLDSKQYKARIKREETLTHVLDALFAVLCFGETNLILCNRCDKMANDERK